MMDIESLRILTIDIENLIHSSRCPLTPLEEEVLCALKSTKEVCRALDEYYKKASNIPSAEIWDLEKQLPLAFSGGQKGERYTMF
jgi:hypothetical protein